MKTFNIVPKSTVNTDGLRPVPILIEGGNQAIAFPIGSISDVADRNWKPNAWQIEGVLTGTAIVAGYAVGLGSFTLGGDPTQAIISVPITDVPLTPNVIQPDFNVLDRTIINWGGYPNGDGAYGTFFADHPSIFPLGQTSGGTDLGGCFLRATATISASLTPWAFKFEGNYYAVFECQAQVIIGIAHPGGDVVLDEGSDINIDPSNPIPPGFLSPQGYSGGFFPPTFLGTTPVGSVAIIDETQFGDVGWGTVSLYNEGFGLSQSLVLKVVNRFSSSGN